MSTSAIPDIPSTMKAVVLPKMGEEMVLQTVPTPSAVAGSVVIKVLVTIADPGGKKHFSGQTFASVPDKTISGNKAVGRVVTAGPDATTLLPGKLVITDPFIRARDDPWNTQILWALFDGPTPASKKFAAANWSAGTHAEYVRVPLENCHPLDEARLLGDPADGGLGYEMGDLLQMTMQVIPYAGLKSIGVCAGETVIVAPATGRFSGAAVQVAVAMGANVIMMSRNVKAMEALAATMPPGRTKVVVNTGDVQADTAALKAAAGTIDAYLDISPAEAQKSTHVRSCIMALKPNGRVSLMGTISNDLAMPYAMAVWNNLTIRGRYMYDRIEVRQLITMVESGILKVGKAGGLEPPTKFSLQDFSAAFDHASANALFNQSTVIIP